MQECKTQFDSSPTPQAAYIYNSSLSGTRPAPLTCQKYNRCGRSDCPECSSYKAHRRQKNIQENVRHRHLYRLVLTLPTSPDLDTLLNHLYDSFKRLRECQYWKKNVRGGLYNLHILHNDSGEWNTHFDILLESDSDNALTPNPLSLAWQRITEDAHNLLLQQVGDTEDDRGRLTTYQTHSAIRDIAHDIQLVKTFLRAIGKRRKFNRFGCWTNTSRDKTRWKLSAAA